ncbi:MAG TPA: PASTA domain-containing protein [Acidimicrobiales bacterium]|nr:PASTA domain-containing protein [Acidimicrobiales bacterium]
MTATEIDAALRERLAAGAPLEQAVDEDEVLAAVRRRVVRRKRRHRGATAAAIVVLVAATAAVASHAFDDRPAVQTGPTTNGTSAGEIDADLLWIGWQEGPTLADPNTGETTPIGPSRGLTCNTCPLIRVGDQAFTAQNGRIYSYTPGAHELDDIGPGDAVFPAADGRSILVSVDDQLEQQSTDGTVLAGPWAIPSGYDLTVPRRATATGVLVEATANAFIRSLAEWDPATGDVQPLGTHNQLIDTHTDSAGAATMIARTDCDRDFPCWILLTDTSTGQTTRIDSPVPGNGFYGGGAFSPDGRDLAVFVATNQGTTDPAARLGIIDTRTGQARLIEDSDVPIGEPYGYASWSPSGDWLFFDGLSDNVRTLERGADQARPLNLAGSDSLVALDRSGRPDTPSAAADITVPDIEGLTLAEASDTLTETDLVLGIDDRLDSDDTAATVIAQEPPAGTPAARQAAIGVRTAAPRPEPASECPAARTVLDGIADGLPALGETDLDRVHHVVDRDRQQLTDRYQALRVLLAHRHGTVYRPDGTGDPPLQEVDDYQIIAELPSSDSCPPAPEFWDGIPVALVIP